MQTVQKTNAARLLDAAGIEYSLVPYEVDEEHLDAGHVAAQLGEDIDQVFKTLVLRGDRSGLFVCVIPGSLEVDLKPAARISGNKNCEMLHVRELLPMTGYIRGGCSPYRNEKAAAHLHTRKRTSLRPYLHQRRRTRASNPHRAPRPHRLRRRGNISDLTHNRPYGTLAESLDSFIFLKLWKTNN